MNSPPGSGHPAMTSPTVMAGTTMPQQTYPNALPPHVTITTSTPVPLESTQTATLQLTIGNEQNEQPRNMLPSFRSILNFPDTFGFVVDQNQTQAINVGGLNVEESAPQESFESSASTYDLYSSTRYVKFDNVDTMALQTNVDGVMQDENAGVTFCYAFDNHVVEKNNNHLPHLGYAKEDVDPNVCLQPKKTRKGKSSSKKVPKIPTTTANIISNGDMQKCVDCNKVFVKACYLTQHVRSFHSGDRPFKCSQCGKRFPDEEQHNRHATMHAMARKHKCESCPKIFAHKTDLKRHLCIHTGKRPFKCDNCGKGFIRQDHMKKHQDTHNRKARVEKQRQAAQRFVSQRVNPNNFQRINIPRLQQNLKNLKLDNP